ncbi:MAG: hypothetical protein ACJ8AI_21275 [Rhodopila sp.]
MRHGLGSGGGLAAQGLLGTFADFRALILDGTIGDNPDQGHQSQNNKGNSAADAKIGCAEPGALGWNKLRGLASR